VGLFELASLYFSFKWGIEDLRPMLGQEEYGGSRVLKITCDFPKLGGLWV
jgi:hypothetical protein